jgi:hypothetical protein
MVMYRGIQNPVLLIQLIYTFGMIKLVYMNLIIIPLELNYTSMVNSLNFLILDQVKKRFLTIIINLIIII